MSLLVKNEFTNAGDLDSVPGWGRFPWRRKWQPTPVVLPGKSHGQREEAGARKFKVSQRVGEDLATEQQKHVPTQEAWLSHLPAVLSECLKNAVSHVCSLLPGSFLAYNFLTIQRFLKSEKQKAFGVVLDTL